MAKLSICCLGPLQVKLDEQPVTDFKSNKVRALLAYLAVEADRPHRREVLAGLLWPDWTDRDALSNLRYSLSNLRRVTGDRTADPPYLLITRDELQFNTASDFQLDISTFLSQVEAAFSRAGDGPDLLSLEEAIPLYRGEFLEGFSVHDSPAYEEWVLYKRQRIARQLLSALRHMAEAYEQNGQFGLAQTFARRQMELEPWDEVAHQQLLRTLALDGQRNAALAHYETYRQRLEEELGVEPTQETRNLYEQIRAGELNRPPPTAAAPIEVTAAPPPFLEVESRQLEPPVFVARAGEMARLDGFLELALTGQARVAFVTGEAGSGKTALIQEFSRRSLVKQPDLIAVSGNCNAYTGLGDPYLPFREILALLTGDVEAKWAAGAMSREHALRLWHALPLTARALVEASPGLLDTLVSRAAVQERLVAYSTGKVEWLGHLDDVRDRRPTSDQRISRHPQSDIFEQYTRVIQILAGNGPLLILLDDLQWADLGSTSLLFHLGRQATGRPILIVGAYRPEEVAIGRDGKRHPLDPVVSEFQRQFGDIIVHLGKSDSRPFAEAFLDSEPNRLGDEFREKLYRRTRGHPLFTIEFLRGLQERGDLARDSEGRWVEGPALNWDTLPARVEAVIGERIERLAQPSRAALEVASVEGETFTAEVVARVRTEDDRRLVRRLSGELDKRHRLVRAQAIERIGLRRISRYRFRNYLFQKYLYDSMDEVQRAYLHEDVGNVLEDIYGEQASEIAVQLAWHFQEAGITSKAIRYLQQAGEKAVHLSAFQEGITHLTRALDLLLILPDSHERAEQELALQLPLSNAWQSLKGAKCPENEKAYMRAYELCQQLGKTDQLCQVLGEMVEVYYVGAEHQRARELGEEALMLAQNSDNLLLELLGHWYLGFTNFSTGEFTTALSHLEQIMSVYDPQEHHDSFVALRGKDPGVGSLAYAACCLWCLGYPDQALKFSQDALALARELNHPFSLADVLSYGGCLFNSLRRDADKVKARAGELIRLSNERVPGWVGNGACYLGEALVVKGQYEQGIERIHEGLREQQSIGTCCFFSGPLGKVAEAQSKLGEPEAALETLAEALAQVEETDERFLEAELYRLRAEILLTQGDEVGAESDLKKAIRTAQAQRAKTLELRASTTLARLWDDQGRREEARRVLESIYDWFTEGFDEPDLKEARALLEMLSNSDR